jgi:integrase
LQRGQQPRRPDACLPGDAATLLMDCALRPEECIRPKWRDSIRDAAIEIQTGTGRGSRRPIPASKRALEIREMRWAEAAS